MNENMNEKQRVFGAFTAFLNDTNIDDTEILKACEHYKLCKKLFDNNEIQEEEFKNLVQDVYLIEEFQDNLKQHYDYIDAKIEFEKYVELFEGLLKLYKM